MTTPMKNPSKPANDHTGEVWNNRKITGWGTFRRTSCGKGSWSWKWVCLNCGATGEIQNYTMLKQCWHWCGARKADSIARSAANHSETWTIPYIPPVPNATDPSKLCSDQCRKCGHSYMNGTICQYILDTGKMRPKVRLDTEPCPVRDVHYRRTQVGLPPDVTTADGAWDLMRRIWAEGKDGSK